MTTLATAFAFDHEKTLLSVVNNLSRWIDDNANQYGTKCHYQAYLSWSGLNKMFEARYGDDWCCVMLRCPEVIYKLQGK